MDKEIEKKIKDKEEEFDNFYLSVVGDWIGYLRKRKLFGGKKKDIKYLIEEYYKKSRNDFLIVTINFYKDIEGKEGSYSLFHSLLIKRVLRGIDWGLKKIKRELIGKKYRKENKDLMNIFVFGGDRKNYIFPHIHSLIEKKKDISDEDYMNRFLNNVEFYINKSLSKKNWVKGYIRKREDKGRKEGFGFSVFYERLEEEIGVEGYLNYLLRYEGKEFGFREDKIIFDYELFCLGGNDEDKK